MIIYKLSDAFEFAAGDVVEYGEEKNYMNYNNRKIYSWNSVFNLLMEIKDSIYREYGISFSEKWDNKSFEDYLVLLNNDYYNKIFSNLDITQKGSLVLLKYKGYQYIFNDEINNDNFWDMYDGIYNECRSIVIDLNSEEITISSQRKFSNLNERKNYMLEDIQEKIDKAKKVEISDKLDGSNQNFSCNIDGIIIGAGSQSLDINNSWRLQDGFSMLNYQYQAMLQDYSDWTFLFEYISQRDAHVVHYSKEQEGLYLFGMRNKKTGKEKTYQEVISIGNQYGVKTTEVFNDTLEGVMSKVDDYSSDEKEGWVISIQDNDGNIFKVKLKVTDYVSMHGLLGKITSANLVVESIAENKFDDFISKVPVAHRNRVDNYAKVVYNYVSDMEDSIREYHHIAPKQDKKEFMTWVTEQVPKKYQGYVRAIYLQQQYNFLKRGSKIQPSYKKFNEILEEVGISMLEVLEDDGN